MKNIHPCNFVVAYSLVIIFIAKVVVLAPHHYNARLQLSKIMRNLGRPDDALRALAQDETEEMLSPHLLFNRCKLLLEERKVRRS